MRLPAAKYAFALAASLAAFGMTIAADRAASLLVPERQAVVFPPHSRFELRTSELAFDANVNSLGFRGPEFEPGTKAQSRVVAIGDSYTYGWGVEDSQAWPKVLETELRRRGIDVEIANLGRPGAGPDQYARITEDAMPVLKPGWIIVGLLQGDDLNQSMPLRREHEMLAAHLMNALYPTLSELNTSLSSAEKRLVITASAARTEWQQRARSLVARLNPDERGRFEALPRRVRERYLDGDLNPYVVELALREPNYFSWLLDESNPLVQKKVWAMAQQLSRIKEVARANGASIVAVSIPNWPYVTHSESARLLGFDLRQEMLRTTAPDDESRRACEAAGIEQIAVTDEIRDRAADSAPLYYPFDGHFTAEGQLAFAEAIAPDLATVLAAAKW
jgi:hypothetical protein